MSNDNFEKQTGRDKFFDIMADELAAITNPATGEIKTEFLEEINCPLCDERDYRLLFKKQEFRFVRCNKCSIIYVNPRIKESELIKAYTEDSTADRIWKDVMLAPAQVAFNDKNYGQILDVIQKEKPIGKLIDIGCSYGHFLKLARERGFEVEGMELENEAVKYARGELNLKIEQKVLAEASYAKESFDVAAALGVLEHVPNPLQFLKEINQILKPGGLLALTMPNVESLVCMMLKDKARAFTGRNHLTYFSIKTLSEMLKRADYEIIWWESYVSGLNSLVNDLQFANPFDDVDYQYVPKEFAVMLQDEDKKEELEKKVCELGLGYKLKVVARKV